MPIHPTSRTIALAATCAALLAVSAASAAPAASPSLMATPRTVVYGAGEIVLTGVVPSKRAGEAVTILSQACRFTEPAAIATVTTRAGGAFRFRIQPMLNTSFRVRWKTSTSAAVRIGVRPVLDVRRIRAGRYRVQVATTNPVFLDGKVVSLQRKAGARWVTIKRARLSKASTETAITVLSAATMDVRTTGTLRAVLPAAQAGCYLGGASATIGA
jgi:hypothetical protein